jgi:hypothetical protein
MHIRFTLLALAALNVAALAADNAAAVPQLAASPEPQATSFGADAITIPQMLSYQGKLTDTAGVPVPNGNYSVVFKLYAVPSGGSPFWSESQSVATRDGLFAVLLGAVTPIGAVPDAGALYLGMAVGGGAELAPRVHIVSTAYAYKADTANYALASAGGDNAWVHGGDSVLYTVRMLGLAKGGGANALLGPSSQFHVNFGFRCTTGLSGQDRFHCTVGGGRNNVASGSYSTVAGGISNEAAGDDASVAGGSDNTASAYASAVAGGLYNTASGEFSVVNGGDRGVALGNYAVIGGGRADTAKALYGAVLSGYRNVAGDSATDTAAVVAGGRQNCAAGPYSFVGGGHGDTATALYGAVLSGHGCRAGDAADDTAATVAGGTDNRATGKYAFVGGGIGNAASSGYTAVAGGWLNSATLDLATVGGGYANLASSSYATVPGGWRDTAAGEMSFATNGNSIVPAAYSNAAAFNGQTATASNQTRVGVLSKASGTFTIDHPLDPQGKILNHYFIEGPEMRNIYDGEVVLDASGRAVVTLPDYFDALNRKPRVQLTGVGTFEVYVAEKVAGNRFVIGGKPGAEVYWQVTGERKDVSAEATRRMMPVEQPKTGGLAGRMLDDDFLSGCMGQLVREGKAQGIDFRTAAGQQRYERMKQATEHR